MDTNEISFHGKIFFMFTGERDKLIDIKTTVKLAADDGIVTFDEIRQNLRQYDFWILLYTICFIILLVFFKKYIYTY